MKKSIIIHNARIWYPGSNGPQSATKTTGTIIMDLPAEKLAEMREREARWVRVRQALRPKGGRR